MVVLRVLPALLLLPVMPHADGACRGLVRHPARAESKEPESRGDHDVAFELLVTFVAGLLCGLLVHERIIHPTLARRANLRRRLSGR